MLYWYWMFQKLTPKFPLKTLWVELEMVTITIFLLYTIWFDS